MPDRPQMTLPDGSVVEWVPNGTLIPANTPRWYSNTPEFERNYLLNRQFSPLYHENGDVTSHGGAWVATEASINPQTEEVW